MANKFISLDNSNFFDRLRKEAPRATELFFMELEKFKTTIAWADVFLPMGMDDDQNFIPREFHDLPYILQKGFIDSFFVGNTIMVYVNPNPNGKKGYTWIVVDAINETYAKSFLDESHTDNTVFATHMQAEIDAFNSAFTVLEDRFGDSHNNTSTNEEEN